MSPTLLGLQLTGPAAACSEVLLRRSGHLLPGATYPLAGGMGSHHGISLALLSLNLRANKSSFKEGNDSSGMGARPGEGMV